MGCPGFWEALSPLTAVSLSLADSEPENRHSQTYANLGTSKGERNPHRTKNLAIRHH